MFSASSAFAQDTTKVLPDVEVREYRSPIFRVSQLRSAAPLYKIRHELITELGAVDLGDALKFVPGAQIKDYGGVGGIKTISFRSMGATYTGVVLDHNPQVNTQVGSINLTSFESFGMNEISFSTGQPSSIQAMPSAYIPAQIVEIKSKLMTRDTSLNYELYQNVTSINAYETAFRVGVPVMRRAFFGTQIFAKYGSGEYPFKYEIAGTDSTFSRTNSRLGNYKVRFAGGYQSKHLRIDGSYLYATNDQHLPGAVILYNPNSNQTLYDRDHRGDVNVLYNLKRSLGKG